MKSNLKGLARGLSALCALVALAVAFLSSALLSQLPAQAQSQATTAGARTVGDGTVFLFTPGKSQSYGTTSGDIGGGNFGQPLYDTNQRWGQSTGIGSSNLQTQQAVAGGNSPALLQRSPNGFQGGVLASPDLNRPFLSSPNSPALNGFGAGLSFTPWQSLGSSEALFNGSGLASSSATANSGSLRSGQIAPSSNIYNDADAVPSFNNIHGGSFLPSFGLNSAGFAESGQVKGLDPRF